MTTAYISDELFLKHDTGMMHPETPDRLSAIESRLKMNGLLDKCLILAPTDVPLDLLYRLHDKEYIERIKRRSKEGGHFRADPDTIGCSFTYAAAIKAAGGVKDAVDAVMSGKATNAFCGVRPPGHHAEYDYAMGFCFFNNIAVGARHAMDMGAKKVAIVDWDVHHGNGTQNAFYEDSSVLYASVHQWPHYPGSGTRDETGLGDGKGTTINIPVAGGSTDLDYRRVFEETILPGLKRFEPDLVMVSAGFDAHEDDPLSNIMLTTAFFGEMTAMLKGVAADMCNGKLVSVLEGGYNLQALASATSAHVEELLGES